MKTPEELGLKPADDRTVHDYKTGQAMELLVKDLEERVKGFQFTIEDSKEKLASISAKLLAKGLHVIEGKLYVKAMFLICLCFFGLGGCQLFKDAGDAAVKTAEGRPADTSTPGGAIGSTLATAALVAAGILLPGVPIAGIVKSLVTALDSSVPAEQHGAALSLLSGMASQLANSVPAVTHDAAVAGLSNSVPASKVQPAQSLQATPPG